LQKERFLRWHARQIKEIIPELLRSTAFEVAIGVVLIIFPSIAIPIRVERGFLPLESLWLLVGTISGGFTLWAHGSYREEKKIIKQVKTSLRGNKPSFLFSEGS